MSAAEVLRVFVCSSVDRGVLRLWRTRSAVSYALYAGNGARLAPAACRGGSSLYFAASPYMSPSSPCRVSVWPAWYLSLTSM